MKLLLAIIILFLAAQGSEANPSKVPPKDGSGASCTGCLPVKNETVDQLRQLRSAVGGDASYRAIYEYNLKRSEELALACSKFAKAEGLGPWGASSCTQTGSMHILMAVSEAMESPRLQPSAAPCTCWTISCAETPNFSVENHTGTSSDPRPAPKSTNPFMK